MAEIDTTEAVAWALFDISEDWDDTHDLPVLNGDQARYIAEIAIEAHNKRLAELIPERSAYWFREYQFFNAENAETASHFFNQARTLFLGLNDE